MLPSLTGIASRQGLLMINCPDTNQPEAAATRQSMLGRRCIPKAAEAAIPLVRVEGVDARGTSSACRRLRRTIGAVQQLQPCLPASTTLASVSHQQDAVRSILAKSDMEPATSLCGTSLNCTAGRQASSLATCSYLHHLQKPSPDGTSSSSSSSCSKHTMWLDQTSRIGIEGVIQG